jgi:hypothetical protein
MVIRVDYREYLKSPWWQAVRRRALALADHRCQDCGWRQGLEVHHRTYERLGQERMADLRVLCRGCHADTHGFMGPPGSCASCGYFAAPDGELCFACAAIHVNPEPLQSIIPRVVAGLATRLADEVYT